MFRWREIDSSSHRTPASQSRVDGLGDRQRSLSPEMWDTLLTTLTPDPEPPSLNSSFASGPTSRTQSTAATSFPTPSAQPQTQSQAQGGSEPVLNDPDCEYEDHALQNSAGRPPRLPSPPTAHPEAAAARMHIASLLRSELEARRPVQESAGSNAGWTRRVDTTQSQMSAERMDETESRRVLDAIVRFAEVPSRDNAHDPALNSAPRREGWIGQLSIGADDDDGSFWTRARSPRILQSQTSHVPDGPLQTNDDLESDILEQLGTTSEFVEQMLARRRGGRR